MKRTILLACLGLAAIVVALVVGSSLLKSNPYKNESYVAMGDSVAAGVGTGTAGSSACLTSSGSYAQTLATSLQVKLTNISCSGAKTTDGLLSTQAGDSDSQLNQLFALPRPGIITMTIGANDVNWIGELAGCYNGACGSAYDRSNFATELQTLSSNLDKVFAQLQAHYGTSVPKLYITGYYQLVDSSGKGTTSGLVSLSDSNAKWIAEMQTSLDDTIKDVAEKYDFATFVPISFKGHELFALDSWIQGLQASYPLHPNESGQTAMAKQLQSSISK